MYHKGYYYAIIALALLGLLTSYILRPSDQEVALMHFQDKYYDEAFNSYKELLQQGDMSVEVVMPLSTLYLQYGDVNNALTLMEKFIALNPASVTGRKQLGTLYQYAQRPDDYLHNLEEIYVLSPTPDVLRELSQIYNFNGMYDKQIKVLEELLEKGADQAKESDYVSLAYLYGSLYKYAKATHVMERLLTKKRYNVSVETMELTVSLMIDAGAPEKAFNLAERFVGNHVTDAVKLAVRFREKYKPKLAYKLLTPFWSKASTNPLLFEEFMNLKLILGESKEVYTYLYELFESKEMTPSMAETLIQIAIDFKDYRMLEIAITRIKPDILSEISLMGFAEIALIYKKPSLAKKLIEKLGTNFLKDDPLLSAVLTFSAEGGKGIEKILKETMIQYLSNEQKVALVRLFDKAGYPAEATQILKTVPIIEALDNLDVVDVVKLFIDLKRVDEGFAILTEARKVNPPIPGQENIISRVEHTWLLLAAGAGREDLLWPSLKKYGALNDQFYADAFYLALDYKHNDLVVKLAKTIYTSAPTIRNTIIMAEAWNLTEAYDKAMALLEPVVATEPEAEFPYLTALGGKIKQMAKAKQDIADYKQKLERLTDKILTRKEILPHEKRAVGYTYIDAGMKEKAITIFFELAQKAPVDSSDVEDVVYLWGKNIDENGIKWLKQRASNDIEENQGRWLLFMNNSGQYAEVANLVDTKKVTLTGKAIDAYMDALIQLRQRSRLASVLNQEIKKESQPERLKKISEMAVQENMLGIASISLEKVIAQNPNDLNAIREMGRVAFFTSTFSKAEKYLGRYLTEKKGTYELYFYYGELLWRKKLYDQAENYYDLALKDIDHLPKKDVVSQQVKAIILYRKNKVQESFAILSRLLKENPANKSLRSDYANLLMDRGHYDEAYDILKNAPPATKKNAPL